MSDYLDRMHVRRGDILICKSNIGVQDYYTVGEQYVVLDKQTVVDRFGTTHKNPSARFDKYHGST